MEGNLVCSLCNSQPLHQFCICSDFPLFCNNCISIHAAKSGFHFGLPLAAREYVTIANRGQYETWFRNLADSQQKLRENIGLMDSCKREIEASDARFTHIKAKFAQSLEELKAALSLKIEEAVQETSSNAYLDYQPRTYLGNLIWTRSYQHDSEPISVFFYQIHVSDVEISFKTTVPELIHMNFNSERVDLGKEIADLQVKLAEGKAREDILKAQSRETASALHCFACKEVELTQEIESLRRELAAAYWREQELRANSKESEFESLTERAKQLQFKLETTQSELVVANLRCEGLEEQVRVLGGPDRHKKGFFKALLSRFSVPPEPAEPPEASGWCATCSKTVQFIKVRGIVCCPSCGKRVIGE